MKIVVKAAGVYRACDHNFNLNETESIIEADPDMNPVSPYKIRFTPDIQWSDAQPNSNYIILMVDVGFGMLNYLALRSLNGEKVLICVDNRLMID